MARLLDAAIDDAPAPGCADQVKAAWWSMSLAILERANGQPAAARLERVDPSGLSVPALVSFLQDAKAQRVPSQARAVSSKASNTSRAS